MKINLTSFFIGVTFSIACFIMMGSIFIPKNLRVNSIEIIDQGDDNSGYIIIKNSKGKSVGYLGVGKSDKGLLTLKNEQGLTQINISSNENGRYFKANDCNSDQSVFIDYLPNRPQSEKFGECN